MADDSTYRLAADIEKEAWNKDVVDILNEKSLILDGGVSNE